MNASVRRVVKPPSTTYKQLPLPFLRIRADRRSEEKQKLRTVAEKQAISAQLSRKRQETKRENERLRVTSQPHPIYGYRQTIGMDKPDSELHRAILDRHQVWGIGEAPLDPRLTTPSLTDGFEHPEASKAAPLPAATRFGLAQVDPGSGGPGLPEGSSQGVDVLRRFVDLRNASSQEIKQETVRRIIQTFGKHETDTSSEEVLVAILTYRLLRCWAFLQDNPKSMPERLRLRALHAQRRQLLRRMQSDEPERFQSIIRRCGIDERAAIARVVFVRTLEHRRRRLKLAARPPTMKPF